MSAALPRPTAIAGRARRIAERRARRDRPAVELRRVTSASARRPRSTASTSTIGKGEFFSLLGPSGCGKTTTLNLIGGFESTPTRGTVLIDGKPVQDMPAHARPVNTVFQSYALFPHMSVAENVGFGLRMKKVPNDERRRAAPRCCRSCRSKASRSGGRAS